MVRTPRTPSVTENSEFETAVHWPAVAAGGGLALGLLAALLSVAWLSSGRPTPAKQPVIEVAVVPVVAEEPLPPRPLIPSAGVKSPAAPGSEVGLVKPPPRPAAPA